MFKPDLRKRSIARVYDAALEAQGLNARVAEVHDDTRRGLVAKLSRRDDEEAAVAKCLGAFTRPWDWTEKR